MPEVFVGRQPIYTRQLEVMGYELLFRCDEVNRADITDGERATSQVIHDAFIEIGLSTIVGSKLAFINMTRDFIIQDYAILFPTDRVVLEVLEDITVDTKLVDAIRNLSERGYTIALDDFVFHDHLRPLVDIADIVKVDVLALNRRALARNVAQLRQYDVRLLAEKVERHDDFAYSRDLGFDYYQGNFLCQPDIVVGNRSPTNRPALLRLLAKLQDPATDLNELERIISQDVSLSYKLLRFVEAAADVPARGISIHHALLLLGERFLRAWSSLLLLADIAEKPHELMVTAMVRGKMCELLAKTMGLPEQDRFFAVGLFSVLDAMLDSPMTDVVASIPLEDNVARALISHQGILGRTLHCVLAYERGEWRGIDTLGVGRTYIRDAYLQALTWTSKINAQVANVSLPE